MESPVDEGGLYNDSFSEMKGVHILKANKILVRKDEGIWSVTSLQHFYS